MVYRATNESCTLTNEERVAEAKRILFGFKLADCATLMLTKEGDFVRQMTNRFSPLSVEQQNLTIKQLWRLRDLKEKYLD